MSPVPTTPSRRQFLKTTSIVAAGAWIDARGALCGPSPNERLSIGVIGVANRGNANLQAVRDENVVALCDVDRRFLENAASQFPKATTYTDYRKLLDRDDLDAVVVSTPDHTHAGPTLKALRRGLHVYCEKPLTHTVREAREVRLTAEKHGRITQMGTQIHASGNYRRVVEVVRSGAIGNVTDVHVFCDKNWGGATRPTETPAVPDHLDFDLWLGPAPPRPYHPTYHPANWRRFWDFGGGTLADMACHFMDLPFWALELDAPTRVEAEGPKADSESAPPWVVVRYRFPKRGDRPALNLTWYDGKEGVDRFVAQGLSTWRNGVLFVGDKGRLLANYGSYKLLPEQEFEGYEPPAPTIPDSIGHHREWIEACKTGGSTTCRFDYAGRLTETVLLGTVAHRAGSPFEWNAETLEARGAVDVSGWIRKAPREGWES